MDEDELLLEGVEMPFVGSVSFGVGAVMRGELKAYHKKQKETYCRTIKSTHNSPQGAFHASLLIRIGKLARDEHLLLRDDFERLGDEV